MFISNDKKFNSIDLTFIDFDNYYSDYFEGRISFFNSTIVNNVIKPKDHRTEIFNFNFAP